MVMLELIIGTGAECSLPIAKVFVVILHNSVLD